MVKDFLIPVLSIIIFIILCLILSHFIPGPYGVKELRGSAYFGFLAVVLMMLIEMVKFGWNESLFIYSFPFNQMQPLRVHYITVIICAIVMGLSLHIYRNIEFLRSVALSTLLVLLGLSGFELMWHYGRGFGYGVGPEFWLFYMLLSFACFTYGQRRWVEPRLSLSNATTYVVIYCTQFGFWAWFSEATNFYPSLLLFDEHNGPNPHSVGFFVFKSTVLMLPLILIDRGKEQ